MTNREKARELREQGMTYQKIADELGVTKAYIAQLVSGFNPRYFRAITEEACIYPGLREWMNDNKVGRSELVRRMGKHTWPATVSTLSYVMRGDHEPTKGTIDSILKVTGMTYEECFGGAEDG